MARIDDIERRLLNWARWKAGGTGGGLGYSASNWQGSGADRGGYREATIPTSDCEGAETDAAVLTLPAELRRTLELVYVEDKGVKLAALMLFVAEPTVKARVWRAHYVLQAWFVDKAQQRRQERERVEALGR